MVADMDMLDIQKFLETNSLDSMMDHLKGGLVV